MSSQDPTAPTAPTTPTEIDPPCWSGPSEPQSATEHQAALDATVFRAGRDPYEVVLELDAGKLRLRGETEEG